MKISILLPYKENFSPNYPGAVSLFVKDTTLISKYRNIIKIFGSTHYKKKLLRNYVNIKSKRKIFQSSNKLFVNNFIKSEKKLNSDIIEVHNRPKYLNLIKNNTKAKIILYFHNDPLAMSGSKTVQERNGLLKISNKIVFNSNWSRNRFMIGLSNENFNDKLTTIYQSASKTKIKCNKKENEECFFVLCYMF